MERIQVSRTEACIARIIARCYPEYRGRKVYILPQTCPLDCKSYWAGGSRSYFMFYNLATNAVCEVPQQSAFDRDIRGLEAVELPEGFACIEHVYFCGKDLGVRIHVNPANLAKLLPQGASDANANL